MNEFYNLLLVLASAGFMGIIISIIYNLTHSRAVYSSRMSVVLVVLAILSAMLLSVEITAGGAAIIGAAIIIRFRNPIKDHRDIIFILASIISGFCSATHMFMALGVETVILVILLIILNASQKSDRVLMIVKGVGSEEERIIESIMSVANGKLYMLENNSVENEVTELIYEVKKCIDPFEKASQLKEIIYNLSSITEVHIMYQDSDMAI